MRSSISNPLVSVIVPTHNSENTLSRCLMSIKNQSYKNIEIIVVDRDSTDDTKKIAQKFTSKIYNKGPERSAQVNFGAKKARGAYFYKVDSDFVLDKRVVRECVRKASMGFDAIVVHNSPDISVSWIAKIRKFECDMYKFDADHSSARFVRKEVYKKVRGFNESVTAGEDYDFQNRLNKGGFRTGYIEAEALHLGEPKSLWRHLVKYYQYGKDFRNLHRENPLVSQTQLSVLRPVYLRNWRQFLRHPLTGIVFIVYHILKFGFGGLGYLVGK